MFVGLNIVNVALGSEAVPNDKLVKIVLLHLNYSKLFSVLERNRR